jgi:hypothetical protein
MRNTYTVLFGKPQGARQHKKYTGGLEDNIKTGVREMVYENMDKKELTRNRTR